MVKKLLPIIIIALIVIAFFYKIVFLDYVLVDMTALADKLPWSEYLPQFFSGERTPYTHSDSSSLYFPIFKFYAGEFKKGNFPLWMPALAGGYPILANSTAQILNPFSLLLLILPVPLGYTWALILKIFLAGLGIFLYLRFLKIKILPALLGAIVYMFNSLLMLKLEIPWMTQSLWSIPYILLLIEKTFQKKKIYLAFLTSLFLSLQFIGAQPQTGMYVTGFAFLYTLFLLKKQKMVQVKRIFLLGFLPFILLPFLAAVQLLPMWELQSLGHRTPNEPAQWISPLHLITSIMPKFFGDTKTSFEAVSKIERNVLSLLHLNFPTITLPYIGLLPFIFALSAIFSPKRSGYIKFFGVIAGILILIQLTTPFWANLGQKIPLINKMWNTYRVNIIYIFSLAALSAFGFNYLLIAPQSQQKILKKILKGLAVIFGLTLICIFILRLNLGKEFFLRSGEGIAQKFYPEKSASEYQNQLNDWYHILTSHFNLSNSTLYLPLLLFLISSIFLALFSRKRFKLIPIFLLLITLLDLWIIGWFYNPMKVKAKDVFPEIPPISFLKQDQSLYRVSSTQGFQVIFPNSLAAYNISDIGIEYNIYLRRYDEYMSFIESSERASLANPFHTNLWLTRYNSPLLDIFNVKYIITPPEQPIPEKEFVLVYNQEMKIYENKKALPRAFLVPQVKVIKDKEKILESLASPEFTPLQTAIFEEEPKIRGSEEIQNSTLSIIQYEPEEVKLKVNLTSDGFLILTDTYYPGWEVYVDGEKDKIYSANYLSRGVALFKGDHEVVFKFEPKSVKRGLYISLTTLGVILVVGLAIRWLHSLKP